MAWLSARAQGGRVVLRMEDLDHPKVKPHAAQQALEDLRWMGLDWDEGPDCGGPYAPYTQTERIVSYRAALDSLRSRGRVYPCICTRRDVERAQAAPHADEEGPRYPGTCRRNEGLSYEQARARLVGEARLPAWRFRVPVGESAFVDRFHGPQSASVEQSCGDFVIGRHPDGAGYMLAVVVDDAAMRITEVVRGDDLLPATHRQLLLYEALGLTPPAFMHVPLVVGENGLRLAKRHGDTRLSSLREQGVTPERVVGLLAWWCGWVEHGTEIMPRDLVPVYDPAAIPRAPVVLTTQVRAWLGIRP